MIARLRMPLVALSIALIAASCSDAQPNRPAFTGDISVANPPVEETSAPKVSGEAPDATPLTAAEAAELKTSLALIQIGRAHV